MSFPDCPDCSIPPSDQRCEAITKLKPNGQVGAALWSKEPHRCVRSSVTGRDGHMVCSIHNRAKGSLTYWDGETPDSFRPRNPNRRSKM